MFLTQKELEQEPYAKRYTKLRTFCEEQKQMAIPKLLDEAVAYGGIREDVLEFFERNRDLTINREIFLVYLFFLTGGGSADEKWYDLIKELSGHKEEPVQKRFFKEVMEAYKAGIPIEMVRYALTCHTAYEFQCYCREYVKQTEGRKEVSKKEWKDLELLVDSLAMLEQTIEIYEKASALSAVDLLQKEEWEEKCFELQNDVRYYKRLYQGLHCEIDRLEMSLLQVRKENRQLKEKQNTESYGIFALRDTVAGSCQPEKAVSQEPTGNALCDTMAENCQAEKTGSKEAAASALRDTVAESCQLENTEAEEVAMSELCDIVTGSCQVEKTGLKEVATSELRDKMAGSCQAEETEAKEVVTNQLRDRMAESCQAEKTEAKEVVTSALCDTMAESIHQKEESQGSNTPKKNPIALFVQLVQTVRKKRFQRKKDAEKRRELIMLMKQNQYGTEQQNLVLSALQNETVSLENLWSMVYQGFTNKQLLTELDSEVMTG